MVGDGGLGPPPFAPVPDAGRAFGAGRAWETGALLGDPHPPAAEDFLHQKEFLRAQELEELRGAGGIAPVAGGTAECFNAAETPSCNTFAFTEIFGGVSTPKMRPPAPNWNLRPPQETVPPVQPRIQTNEFHRS